VDEDSGDRGGGSKRRGGSSTRRVRRVPYDPKRRRDRTRGFSLYQRADGRWVARKSFGKSKQIAAYGKTAKDAADKLRVLLAMGSRPPAAQQPLVEFVGAWISEEQVAGRFAGGTADLYRGALKTHIAKRVTTRLMDFGANDLRALLSSLERSGVSAGRESASILCCAARSPRHTVASSWTRT
jgi:hypothetical protein